MLNANFLKSSLAAAVLGLAAVAAPSAAQAAELLGCRDVGFQADRDVIRVGKEQGKWTAIKLTVAGNLIEVFDVTVVYGNGKTDALSVRNIIQPGSETRWLDLRGDGKKIDRIELVYRAIPAFRGKATVCALGR